MKMLLDTVFDLLVDCPKLLATEIDFFQSIVSSTLNIAARGNQKNATKLKDVQDVVTKFASKMAKFGLFAHKQSLRFVSANAKRIHAVAIISFLKELVKNANLNDREEKDIKMQYIVLMEGLEGNCDDADLQEIIQYLGFSGNKE